MKHSWRCKPSALSWQASPHQPSDIITEAHTHTPDPLHCCWIKGTHAKRWVMPCNQVHAPSHRAAVFSGRGAAGEKLRRSLLHRASPGKCCPSAQPSFLNPSVLEVLFICGENSSPRNRALPTVSFCGLIHPFTTLWQMLHVLTVKQKLDKCFFTSWTPTLMWKWSFVVWSETTGQKYDCMCLQTRFKYNSFVLPNSHEGKLKTWSPCYNKDHESGFFMLYLDRWTTKRNVAVVMI